MLAALASVHRGGHRRGRLAIGRTLIILAIIHIAIDPTVAVLIGPDRAGQSADHCSGDRTFKQAVTRDQCPGSRSESGTADNTGTNAAES